MAKLYFESALILICSFDAQEKVFLLSVLKTVVLINIFVETLVKQSGFPDE